MKLSIEDCTRLLEQLSNYSFIKQKRDTVFLLHDEMQRLINQYYWKNPVIDPDLFFRKKIARTMVSYYDDQLKNSEGNNSAVLSAERFHYQLYVDTSYAVNECVENMDDLLEHYHIYHIQLLLQEVIQEKNHQIQLSDKSFQIDICDQLKIDICQMKWLNAQYRCEEVLIIFKNIEKDKSKTEILETNAQNRIDIFSSVGEAYVWLYQFDKAIQFFQKAAKSARQLNDTVQESWMKNWVGYSYIRMGNYNRAFSTIKQAINRMIHEGQKCVKNNNKIQALDKFTARLGIMYGNLNLLRYQGGYYEASIYGEIAVSVLKKQDNKQECAKMLTALGESLKFSNKSYHAFLAFQLAQTLTQDPLIQARTEIYLSLIHYRHLDYIYLIENFSLIASRTTVMPFFQQLSNVQIDEAEAALNRSENWLKNSPHRLERSTLMFYKGLFYTVKGAWDNAIENFSNCESLCQEISHGNLLADACVERMRCLYFSKNLTWEQCLDFDKQLEAIGDDFHNIQAKKWNIMGNVQYDLYIKNRNFDHFKKAILYYLHSCESMYNFGKIRKGRFYNALRTFTHRLCQLKSSDLPKVDELESLRDIWEWEKDEFQVTIRYSHILNELLDFTILRVQSKGDPDKLINYQKSLSQKVKDWVQFGGEQQRLVPMYAQLLLQISKDLEDNNAQIDAYHLLGYAHYINNTMFLAHYFYQKSLDIISHHDRLNSLFYARLLIRLTAPLSRREVFIKIVNFCRKKDVRDEFLKFKNLLGKNLIDTNKDLETAETILSNNEKMFIREQPNDFFEIKALLYFRKAEQLMVDDFDKQRLIENSYRQSIEAVNQMKDKDYNRYMKSIEGLITYYYLSDQYDEKEDEINRLLSELTAINREHYKPHVMAHAEITMGDNQFDRIFDSSEPVVHLQKAFKHYLNAMNYYYDHSEMEIFECARLVIQRIAELPKEFVLILSQDIYPPLGYLKTAGENADKLYKLIEECLIIHGELL
ncbi:MAG: hypothetical protein HQK75_11305 [Candidatus Magnetomorum sp.]|nr:hypothetical protein [Candidatus Magnetomorum sp.]